MAKKRRTTPKKLPDRLELLQKFTCSPDGELTLRKSGRKVGWKDKRGYCHVSIDKEQYKMHRIIYKMWHGIDPGNRVVDHRDGNPSNNCITNLRLCRHRDNLNNMAHHRSKVGLPKEDRLSEQSSDVIAAWNGHCSDF